MFQKVLLMWETLSELSRKTDNWRQIYEQTSSIFDTSNDLSLKRVDWKEKINVITKKFLKNLLTFTLQRRYGCLITFHKICSWNWKKLKIVDKEF